MTYRPSVGRALISVRQMYEADARAAALGIPGATLMEAAGAAVASAILVRYEPRPVLVLCGPGNNGGDGFVAARHLRAAGLSVDVAMAAPVDALSGDARRMAQEWLRASGGIAQRPFGPDAVEEGEIVVDALFGAGLTRDLDGAYADVVRAVDALGAPVVAVDVPSGICGDTGRVRGCAAQADLTITFAAKKPGHVLLPGRTFCGETVVADIGIPASVMDEIAPEIFENDPSLWLDRFPAASLEDHKYVRGHTLVLSGGVGKTGAARLAARGALRAGSGLVTIAPPSAALSEVAAQVTAIMTEPLDNIDDLGELLERRRIRAAVVGPGNGIGARTAAAVGLLLDAEVPTVIDADGLMSFETDPGALIGDLHDGAVLTPTQASSIGCSRGCARIPRRSSKRPAPPRSRRSP